MSLLGRIKDVSGSRFTPVEPCCLFFYPDADCPHTSLKVLCDFVPPGAVKISRVTVKGVPLTNFAPDNFRIELEREDLGGQIVVEFPPKDEPRTPGGQP